MTKGMPKLVMCWFHILLLGEDIESGMKSSSESGVWSTIIVELVGNLFFGVLNKIIIGIGRKLFVRPNQRRYKYLQMARHYRRWKDLYVAPNIIWWKAPQAIWFGGKFCMQLQSLHRFVCVSLIGSNSDEQLPEILAMNNLESNFNSRGTILLMVGQTTHL